MLFDFFDQRFRDKHLEIRQVDSCHQSWLSSSKSFLKQNNGKLTAMTKHLLLAMQKNRKNKSTKSKEMWM